MKKMISSAGMLVMVLVFGIAVIGCDNGTTGVDSALNGTWVSAERREEFRFNNGSFEYWLGEQPILRGIYTTTDNNISIITTHAHSDFFGDFIGEGPSRWVARAEFHEIFGLGFDYRDMVDMTFTYSIIGNTLMLVHPEGVIIIFSRR